MSIDCNASLTFYWLFAVDIWLIAIVRIFTVKSLIASGRPARYINFPDRTTECGGLINSYLTNNKDFNDETIHLLFTLNRWEAKSKMETMLYDGITLVVDRYSYSGVAFSAAKGLDVEWCKAPEAGLLKPDLVLLLTMTAAAISQRGGFGDERLDIANTQCIYVRNVDGILLLLCSF